MKKTMKPMDNEKMDTKAHEKKESRTVEAKEVKMTGNVMKDGCVKCSMDKVK